MLPYYLLISLILIIQFKYSSRRVENIRFYIGIGALFLFAALRGVSNGDYDAYLIRGSGINSVYKIFNNNTSMEIGYSILYYFINLFHFPKQGIIIAMNLISFCCITKFIDKYSVDRCLSLLLFLPFYFQFDMHAARTAVAISITAVSVNYVIQRRFFRFCLMVFFATLFHRSSIIVFPIYFIFNLHIDLFFGLFSILGSMCFVYFIGVDRTILEVLYILGLKGFYAKYYGYVNNARFGYAFSLLDPRLWICIFIYISAKHICKNHTKLENLFINCSLINVLIMIWFSEHTIFCCRLSAFWNVYSIVLIPSILKNIYISQNKRNKNGAIRWSKEARIITIAFYTVYGIAYAYVCFISLGLNYKFFF